MNKTILLFFTLLAGQVLFSQNEVKTQFGRHTGQEKFPIYTYSELEPHEKADVEE